MINIKIYNETDEVSLGSLDFPAVPRMDEAIQMGKKEYRVTEVCYEIRYAGQGIEQVVDVLIRIIEVG